MKSQQSSLRWQNQPGHLSRSLRVWLFLLLPGLSTTSLPLGLCPAFGQEPPVDAATELDSAISAIRALGPNGSGHAEAIKALGELSRVGGETSLMPILSGMRGASPIAKNWLRVLAAETAQSSPLPRPTLEAFFYDLEQDSDARYLVFRWLTDSAPESRESILDKATSDPCLPLRYLANARLIQRAESVRVERPQEALRLYRRVLSDARNPEQLRTAANAMQMLGEEVDLASRLGLFTRWFAIGPFDNRDGHGFSLPRGPETWIEKPPGQWGELMRAPMEGKAGEVSWKIVTTGDAMGMVDLNAPFDREKEAVVFLYSRFQSPQAGVYEARLGSTNANKVWVNGDLITANEVYHAGSMIDQYVAPCELRMGDNWVLLKICQNNQTESWAQDWQFQFRITDTLGTPVMCESLVPVSN